MRRLCANTSSHANKMQKGSGDVARHGVTQFPRKRTELCQLNLPSVLGILDLAHYSAVSLPPITPAFKVLQTN
eukprot:4560164-Amphidinium_carterae.2